jgi:hypothetical protein
MTREEAAAWVTAHEDNEVDGVIAAVMRLAADTIERCAKEAERRLVKLADGSPCECARCEEAMSVARNIRAMVPQEVRDGTVRI